MSDEKRKDQPKEPKLVANQNLPTKPGLYWMKQSLEKDHPFDTIASVKGQGSFLSIYAWKTDGTGSHRLITDTSNVVFGPELTPPKP